MDSSGVTWLIKYIINIMDILSTYIINFVQIKTETRVNYFQIFMFCENQ